MKINLLPLSINGNVVSNKTLFDIIQRGYRALYAACVVFAKEIQRAAEIVPAKFEDCSWMQNQLYYKVRNAEWELEYALDFLAAHQGLDFKKKEPDADEISDWKSRSLVDRKQVRANFYAQARHVKQQAAALRDFAKSVRNDDGQPDPVLAPWGWCGRQLNN